MESTRDVKVSVQTLKTPQDVSVHRPFRHLPTHVSPPGSTPTVGSLCEGVSVDEKPSKVVPTPLLGSRTLTVEGHLGFLEVGDERGVPRTAREPPVIDTTGLDKR